jgi:hypothetical protein
MMDRKTIREVERLLPYLRRYARFLAKDPDLADDLVAEDERELRTIELAVRDVEVGPADAAGLHGDEQLPRAGLGPGEVALHERLPRPLQHHRPH